MKNVTFYKFNLEPSNNLRLDQLISQKLPEYSRSRIKNWMIDKKILVNGEACSPDQKISQACSVEVEFSPIESIEIRPEDIPIDVAYEDQDILIINKPCGMVTHTAPGNFSGTMQNALLYKYPELKSVPRSGIIHRLDKHTSGLLIIARSLESHNTLVKQMHDRKIKKKYLSLVTGIISNISSVDRSIGRHTINRKKMAVSDKGKHALTKIHVLNRYEKASFLEIDLITGRTHQIRVHLSYLGHPVIGDKLYGFKKSFFKKYQSLIKFFDKYESNALHASSLTFQHPRNNRPLFIESDPPNDFNYIKKNLEDLSYDNPI